MATIHPTALVDRTAELASSVVIGPYVVIGPQCVLGDNVQIEPFARLVSQVTLAADVRLHSHVVLGDVPQHTAYEEHPGRVEVGPRTILREGVTIHRPFIEGGTTRVGADCFLMANSHVAHDCELGDGVTLVNGALLAGHVVVGNRAILSGAALVHQYCRIGRLAIVSGGAQITMDVPPFAIASKRNVLDGLNIVGLRRAGFTGPQRQHLKRVFAGVLPAGPALSEAVATARAGLDALDADETAPARELLDWLAEEHPRGVLRLDAGEEA